MVVFWPSRLGRLLPSPSQLLFFSPSGHDFSISQVCVTASAKRVAGTGFRLQIASMQHPDGMHATTHSIYDHAKRSPSPPPVHLLNGAARLPRDRSAQQLAKRTYLIHFSNMAAIEGRASLHVNQEWSPQSAS
jgi:hypothetical protein